MLLNLLSSFAFQPSSYRRSFLNTSRRSSRQLQVIKSANISTNRHAMFAWRKLNGIIGLWVCCVDLTITVTMNSSASLEVNSWLLYVWVGFLLRPLPSPSHILWYFFSFFFLPLILLFSAFYWIFTPMTLIITYLVDICYVLIVCGRFHDKSLKI